MFSSLLRDDDTKTEEFIFLFLIFIQLFFTLLLLVDYLTGLILKKTVINPLFIKVLIYFFFLIFFTLLLRRNFNNFREEIKHIETFFLERELRRSNRFLSLTVSYCFTLIFLLVVSKYTKILKTNKDFIIAGLVINIILLIYHFKMKMEISKELKKRKLETAFLRV